MIYAAAIRFDYHFTQSLMARAVGRVDVQVDQARKAREYGLFDHRVLLVEGEGLRTQGDLEAVVAVYQSYLNYQPFLPAVHNNLGRAYEESGDYASAEHAYVRGMKTFAGDGVGVLKNNLAAVYKKRGRGEDALAIYESARDLPAEGFHNLGLIYADLGEFEKAATAYRQALVMDSDMTIAFFSLAGVEMLQGQSEAAAQHYETFLERWRGAPDYVKDAEKRLRQIYPVLGDQFLRGNKTAEAAHVLERLVQLDAATPEVFNNLALIYGKKAQHKVALANAQQALKLDPDFAPAYFTLAMIYDQLAQVAEALKHYRMFLELWEKDDRLSQRAKMRVEELAQP
jgi:tetratricopeptide (TPR) repeat protein